MPAINPSSLQTHVIPGISSSVKDASKLAEGSILTKLGLPKQSMHLVSRAAGPLQSMRMALSQFYLPNTQATEGPKGLFQMLQLQQHLMASEVAEHQTSFGKQAINWTLDEVAESASGHNWIVVDVLKRNPLYQLAKKKIRMILRKFAELKGKLKQKKKKNRHPEDDIYH